MERTRMVVPREVISMKTLYKTYILKLIKKNKKVYGKEITDRIKDHFKDTFYKVSHTTIYSALHTLEEEGYVISSWDSKGSTLNRGKRYYRLTDAGLKYSDLLEKETLGDLKNNRNILDKLIELFELESSQ